jgi:hypothetical protein
MHLLAECRRVLAHGGAFHVGVPDAGEVLEQYARRELPALLREWARDPAYSWFPPFVWRTPMHLINFFFRQNGEHLYAYDEETLAAVLTDAGFVSIRRREFDLALDSPDRRDGTLYMEAKNP